jgi:hypothetical protein
LEDLGIDGRIILKGWMDSIFGRGNSWIDEYSISFSRRTRPHAGFIWWGIVNTLTQLHHLWAVRKCLFIDFIHSYPLHLEAAFSIHKLIERHAAVARDPFNMEQFSFYSTVCWVIIICTLQAM